MVNKRLLTKILLNDYVYFRSYFMVGLPSSLLLGLLLILSLTLTNREVQDLELLSTTITQHYLIRHIILYNLII